jgi:hypothetical protein
MSHKQPIPFGRFCATTLRCGPHIGRPAHARLARADVALYAVLVPCCTTSCARDRARRTRTLGRRLDVAPRRRRPGGRCCVRGAVRLFATCRSFDLRRVFTRPKPVVLACRESSAPDLVVENPRHVVNRRNVPGGRRCVRRAGSSVPRVASAAVKRLQVALEHPALRARLGPGAAFDRDDGRRPNRRAGARQRREDRFPRVVNGARRGTAPDAPFAAPQ